jgi:bacillithiol system protein YtxJ
MKNKIIALKKEIAAIAFIFLLFILVSYWTKINIDQIKTTISSMEKFGPLAYILAMTIAVIIAPISALPIVPVAVGMWGSFNASILSIIGWMSGSSAAFALARYGGRPLIKRLVSLDKVEKFSKIIPEKNLFVSVVFFRIALPVDILSYALGLFTEIKWSTYLLATFLGIAPFAFIFSYAVDFPIGYQIIGGVLGIAIVAIGYFRFNNKAKQKTMIEKISSIKNWQELFLSSTSSTVIILKHSNACPISTNAYSKIEHGLASGEIDQKVYLVVVQENREISNQIEQDLGVKHESPQVIIIKDKKVVYHSSHDNIKIEDIKKSIS